MLLMKALLVDGSITLNRRQQGGQWNGIVQLLKTGRLGLRHLHCFWDTEGAILVDIMPCVRTVNADHYIHTVETLQKRFKGGRTQNVAGIFLQHDNAGVHTSFKM